MKLDSIGNYCMYLRKSRKDIEAEKHGEGETLKRHFDTLMSLANRLKIIIREDAIYKEIVSGDTIASRPVMQQLLADIETGKWDGVLVVEVERLARGDTIDQGIVAQTFKYSNTKIITPMKIYNQTTKGMKNILSSVSLWQEESIKRYDKECKTVVLLPYRKVNLLAMLPLWF